MFDKIDFITTEAKQLLSSNHVPPVTPNKDYDKEAIANAKFLIWGSVDGFHKPPISDFAIAHLYHMQDFSIFHYNSGSFTERQNYNSYLIAYTYSGTGKLSYRGHNYILQEGDGFFINCMDYHLYQVDKKQWTVGILHLNGPLFKDFHSLFMQFGAPIFHEVVTGKYQYYLENLLLLYSRPELNRDWQVSTCIDNMLNHLMLLCCDQAAKNTEFPENIRYLIKYMDSNYSKNLSLDFLSKFCNVNKYYLSKEFKKYTGFSPNDYLITLRINHAKLLLTSTKLPASKIAHEVGVHDINNFTNHFKRKTGMTPIQFRKSNTLYIN